MVVLQTCVGDVNLSHHLGTLKVAFENFLR